MKAMAALGGRRQFFAMIALGLVIGACGGTTSVSNGGESHFLRTCDGACGAGLKCISGICTRACVLGKDSCADLATNAECTDQSIEPGAVVICDVGCSQDRDCSSLGDEYECQAGFCRGLALTTDGAGGQGGSADATGGKRNTGGAAGATGGKSNTGGAAGATGGKANTGGAANAGGAGNENASGAAGAGASCRVLHQTYPSGTSGIPDPGSCNECTCEDGGLMCTLAACDARVFSCPDEIVSDSINIDYYAIQGDKLILDVNYGGGADMQHDFGVCYEKGFRESDPVQGTLRLLHDAHDDRYRGLITTTLSFDLSPYADYYRDQYQADGGLISTNYGMYAFGNLTCDERTQAATAQVDSVVHQLDLSCASADDCKWAYNGTDCSDGCGTTIASFQGVRLTEALDEINASVCGSYVEDGCPSVRNPCPSPPTLDCVDGQCTRQTSAAGGAANAGAGGAAGADGSCRVLHQTYASGTSGIPDPAGCGTCECQDGELSCQEPGCEIGPLVSRCPDDILDIVSDPVDIDYYSIQGDKLVLDVRYGGGCERHDFGVCYEAAFDDMNPPGGGLRLIHDAHDDTCKAIVSANLSFNLKPYADYYIEGNGTDGGLISTNYGMYAFGTLTCDERAQAGAAQVDSVVAQLPLTCSSAADCEWADNVTDCADRCSALIAVSQEARFTQALDDINATVCAGYEADGCTRIVPPCTVPAELDCVDGKCAPAVAAE
jgi:hypothetical protein